MPARVISGKAKGRKLKLVPGDTTRPIMDRVKESLFNILGDVRDQRWLDLFAGTGQVGIEALSRGAAHVVFVDNARAAVATVRDNLASTGLAAGATVIGGDAFAVLRGYDGQPFDVVYIAPPQYKGVWEQVMGVIDAEPGRFVAPEGLVVVQIDPLEYKDLALRRLALDDRRRYGSTLLCFYSVIEGDLDDAVADVVPGPVNGP
jgi:16S rRNA (guanine(966)-N(2))-methyltransferase RsmD